MVKRLLSWLMILILTSFCIAFISVKIKNMTKLLLYSLLVKCPLAWGSDGALFYGPEWVVLLLRFTSWHRAVSQTVSAPGDVVVSEHDGKWRRDHFFAPGLSHPSLLILPNPSICPSLRLSFFYPPGKIAGIETWYRLGAGVVLVAALSH